MEIENIENISLVKMLEESFRKNWNMPALSNYKDITLHYRDVARRIEKLAKLQCKNIGKTKEAMVKKTKKASQLRGFFCVKILQFANFLIK